MSGYSPTRAVALSEESMTAEHLPGDFDPDYLRDPGYFRI